MTFNENFACIGKLNDQFDEIARLTQGIDEIRVPRIAVIGDQSNGKSSLLESMSGVDLPRGAGICTRVPLIMQLRKQRHGQSTEIMIQATTENGKVISEEIKEESGISDAIVRYTAMLAGKQKAIKDLPITLTITKEDVVDLTMIDLPGIVHHDEDLQKMRDIDAMVDMYIKEEETIILNVLNATQEAANSKSLNLSAKYDPKHERTLLVITKIDQTTDGEGLDSKFLSFYQEEHFPVGCVFLVRNRTKMENDSKTDSFQVREREKEFFDRRQDMRGLPDSCKGSQALTHKLAKMQRRRMLEILPKLKKNIYEKFCELQRKKNDFPIVCKSENECRVL